MLASIAQGNHEGLAERLLKKGHDEGRSHDPPGTTPSATGTGHPGVRGGHRVQSRHREELIAGAKWQDWREHLRVIEMGRQETCCSSSWRRVRCQGNGPDVILGQFVARC